MAVLSIASERQTFFNDSCGVGSYATLLLSWVHWAGVGTDPLLQVIFFFLMCANSDAG
jgi:hypothetical protein